MVIPPGCCLNLSTTIKHLCASKQEAISLLKTFIFLIPGTLTNMPQTDKRYGCTLCTNLPAPGYLDRLETKSRTHRKYSLQHHVERCHPHVTDWTSLKRELPSVERKRHNVSSASSRVPNIRSRNSSKTTGSMDRKSLIVRLPMAQDRNTTPHLNNDHEVTAISQRLAHAANVDEEETSET